MEKVGKCGLKFLRDVTSESTEHRRGRICEAALSCGFPPVMGPPELREVAKGDARTHVGAGVREHVMGLHWGENQEESANALVDSLQKSWAAVSLDTRINGSPTSRAKPGEAGRGCAGQSVQRSHLQKSPTHIDKLGSPEVGQDAEVTDADESLRQDVKQESSDELVGRDGHRPRLVAAGIIAPTKTDMVAIE